MQQLTENFIQREKITPSSVFLSARSCGLAGQLTFYKISLFTPCSVLSLSCVFYEFNNDVSVITPSNCAYLTEGKLRRILGNTSVR